MLISSADWAPPASAITLTLTDADGDTPAKAVEIPAGATLDQAVTAINAANAGVAATASRSVTVSRPRSTKSSPTMPRTPWRAP